MCIVFTHQITELTPLTNLKVGRSLWSWHRPWKSLAPHLSSDFFPTCLLCQGSECSGHTAPSKRVSGLLPSKMTLCNDNGETSMMLGCAWLWLQKHQSAKGGGTLKVCWSCVDLPRPLETQTVYIFCRQHSADFVFSFVVLSCFRWDRWRWYWVLCCQGIWQMKQFSSELATKSKLLSATVLQGSLPHWFGWPGSKFSTTGGPQAVMILTFNWFSQFLDSLQCFHSDVITYWSRMSWLFGLMQFRSAFWKACRPVPEFDLASSLAFRVCFCVFRWGPSKLD